MKTAVLWLLLMPLNSATSQTPALKPELIRRGVDTMVVFVVMGRDTTETGFVIDDIATVEREGKQVLRRVYRSADRTLGTRIDTIFDDVTTLTPIAVRSHTSASREVVDFTNGRAIGWLILANGDSIAIDVALPRDAFNGSSFDLVLRSTLFHDRWRAVIPSFVAATRTIIPMSALFGGTEEIDGVATLRIRAEVAGMPVTFWIDPQSRRLVRQVMQVRPGFEILFTPSRPRISPPRRVS